MQRGYKLYKPHNKRKWFLLGAIAVVVVIAAASFWFVTQRGKKASAPVDSAVPVQATNDKLPTEVEGKYLISGTIVLDRVVVTFAGNDYNQPFSHLSTMGKYDGGIADLECPVTYNRNKNDINVDSPRFNCRPEWLPSMKKYFQIIKLAGNHTYDMGADGFTQSVTNIQKAGMQAVGHYNPHADPDNNCEVVSLPVRLQNPDKTESKTNMPVAICAFNYKIIFAPEAGEIEQITRYAKIMPVFGLLQSGAEYQNLATPEKKVYAHKMIDAGADFVIGNGAHGVQESEAYKGKLIVYSLGNFIFDQLDAETNRGLSIALGMKVPYDDNVAKWIALGKSCKPESRDDTCLEQAEKAGLTRFNASYTYEPIASSTGVRTITTRGSSTLQKAIEQRLNWSQTLAGLKQQ
jgi:hypothetical protein